MNRASAIVYLDLFNQNWSNKKSRTNVLFKYFEGLPECSCVLLVLRNDFVSRNISLIKLAIDKTKDSPPFKEYAVNFSWTEMPIQVILFIFYACDFI